MAVLLWLLQPVVSSSPSMSITSASCVAVISVLLILNVTCLVIKDVRAGEVSDGEDSKGELDVVAGVEEGDEG